MSKRVHKPKSPFPTRWHAQRWRERLPWISALVICGSLYGAARLLERRGNSLVSAVELSAAVAFLAFAVLLVAYAWYSRCPECRAWMKRKRGARAFRCSQCRIDWQLRKKDAR